MYFDRYVSITSDPSVDPVEQIKQESVSESVIKMQELDRVIATEYLSFKKVSGQQLKFAS